MNYLATATAAVIILFSVTAAQALSVNVTDNTSAQVGVNTSGQANASASDKTSATVEVSPLIITQAAVTSTMDSTASTGSTSSPQAGSGQASAKAAPQPSTVRTNAELSSYASALVHSDVNVGQAELSTTSVSLSYTQQADLFGFIPVSVVATAQVDADGTISVSYPWYSFLASTNGDTLQADITTATEATMKANANGSFSTATQAQLLSEMHAAMQTDLDASLAAQGSANTSGQ